MLMLPRPFRHRAVTLGLIGLALFGLGLAVATIGSTATATPQTGRMRAITDAEAGVILGVPTPSIQYPGLVRTSLQARPLEFDQSAVSLSYAMSTAVPAGTVAQLDVFKAPGISRLETSGVTDVTLGGVPMKVMTKTVTARDGPLTFVSYAWSRRTLSVALTIYLRQGLTRDAADAMAASVR